MRVVHLRGMYLAGAVPVLEPKVKPAIENGMTETPKSAVEW